ncbi:hypothetical protein BDV98DRAFT_560103 [Pterulicium gracile]|uniref:Extracellular membrane protein CFEM domain-containing protein n=1 Tax=Pterulicium gracile TaxID=1884261 RepID=A0A5C3QVW2_9AGAR|nr:hypothetical protein BDV98DRAFT_560103 [Pterula gracilis]
MFLAAVSLALALVYATAALGPIFQLQLAAEVEVVPTQCVESCSPVENIIRTSCTVIECCTEAFEAAYFDCLSCVGQALNVTDYSPAQHSFDTLIAACGVRQIDLGTNRTFPGEDPDRVIATSSLLESASAAFQPNSTDVLPSSLTSQANITDLPGASSSSQATVTDAPGASSPPQGTLTAPGEPEPTQDGSSGANSASAFGVGAAMLQVALLYTLA